MQVKSLRFKEILKSPVFRNFVISEDGKTSGIIVNIKQSQSLENLENKSKEEVELIETKKIVAKHLDKAGIPNRPDSNKFEWTRQTNIGNVAPTVTMTSNDVTDGTDYMSMLTTPLQNK